MPRRNDVDTRRPKDMIKRNLIDSYIKFMTADYCWKQSSGKSTLPLVQPQTPVYWWRVTRHARNQHYLLQVWQAPSLTASLYTTQTQTSNDL